MNRVSKERALKKLVALQNLRPRICYVLSLLRIHSPECKHCMASLTAGDALRIRLKELNGPTQECRTRMWTIESHGEPRQLSKPGDALRRKSRGNPFGINEPWQRAFMAMGWVAGPCETQNPLNKCN